MTNPARASRPRRLRIVLRPIPAAMIVALAVLAAAPLIGGAAPRQDILGTVDVAQTSSAPAVAATDAIDTTFAPAPVRRGDPLGEASSPSRRYPPDVAFLTGYRWPVRNASLTLPFGPSPWGGRVVNGQPFHDGIDLASHCGDRITAAHGGTVLAAGRHYDAFMGWLGDLSAYTARLDEKHLWLTLPNVVVIDDGNGYRSIYAHFRRVVVAPGDVVEAGDLLGYEGATGRATGCHLHYGLFSPDEIATIGLDPVAAAHMLLPSDEIARIDPQLVLPPWDAAGIH